MTLFFLGLCMLCPPEMLTEIVLLARSPVRGCCFRIHTQLQRDLQWYLRESVMWGVMNIMIILDDPWAGR